MDVRVGYCATGFYKSASIASTDGLSWVTASGDQAMAYDRQTMIEVSRHFYRNNPIYKGIIDRAAAYIVGDGFSLQMRSNSDSYNEKAESLWKEWWERPEIRGLNTGRIVARMSCTETLLTGGAILLKLDSGMLQQIEIEQCRGKNLMTDGITKDAVGKPKKFRIFPYSNNGQIDLGKEQQIDADNVLFVANRDRPSATHGVPALQSTFANLHRINDTCDSEALAWQTQSRIVLVKNQDPSSPNYGGGVQSPNATDGSLATHVQYMGYAMIFNAALGETLQALDRKIPGQSFPETCRMFLRLLGLPIGMPLELILLDWTQSNFSQTRAVLEQVYQTFTGLQYLQEGDLYRPMLPWKIDQWVQQGRLPERAKDGYRHEWIMPTFPWINELEEAKAKGEQLDRTFTTLGAICKGLQTERSEVCDAREAEIRDAIARAQRIEADTKIKVPWEYFAGLKIPQGQAAPPVPTETNKKADQKNGNE
jgi:capsid protein